MPAQTFWERTKVGSKVGFDKVYGWVDKIGAPVNRLSNKLGSEAFWPTTLDKESDKAARILRSFCKDGFYEEEIQASPDGPKAKQKVLKKIPSEVIKRARGLAIFTTMRTGLWVSGAGGSGILVARKEDGTWSPPSGIMLHTAGLGFLVGVDIYDCVVVINTQKALDAFSKIRCTLGGEVSATAGPLGIGGVLESELHKRQAPVFTYLKSRGFYAGVQIDGTVVIERTDENERFYNERISVANILTGKVRHPPFETRKLLETIRSAEGETNIDESLLPSEPAPGDYEIEASGHVFGVPDKEDPDPFGVLALEKEGLEIREAGTQARPSVDAFNFAPSPRSPIFGAFNRQSIDTQSIRSNSRRASQISNYDRVVSMSDMSTQTDIESPTFHRPSSAISQTNGIRDSIQSRIIERPELEEDYQSSKSPESATFQRPLSKPGANGIHIDTAQQATEKYQADGEAQTNSPRTNKSTERENGFNGAPLVNGTTKKFEEPIRQENLGSPNGDTGILSNGHKDKEHEKKLGANQNGEVALSEENEDRTVSYQVSISHVNGQEIIPTPIEHDTIQAKKSDETHKAQDTLEDFDDLSDDDEFDDVAIIEEPVVVQQVQSPPVAQSISRPRVVQVSKAIAPQLPPRNPIRNQRLSTPSRSNSTASRPSDEIGSTNAVGTPTESAHYPTADTEPEAPSVPARSVTNSIAKLRAFEDDEDTVVGDEKDEFHSVANSRGPSPTTEKYNRI